MPSDREQEPRPSDRKCPRCGGEVWTDGHTEWCVDMGSRPVCLYGLDALVPAAGRAGGDGGEP